MVAQKCQREYAPTQCNIKQLTVRGKKEGDLVRTGPFFILHDWKSVVTCHGKCQARLSCVRKDLRKVGPILANAISLEALNLSFHVRGIDLQVLLNHDLSNVIRFVPEIWQTNVATKFTFAIRAHARDSIYVLMSIFRIWPQQLMMG